MLSSPEILAFINKTVNRNFWLFLSGSVNCLIIQALGHSMKYVPNQK